MADALEDWNPTSWLVELKQALLIAGNGYMRLVNAEDEAEELENYPGIRANRTSFAMLAVGTVLNKLAEVPGMREHIGLVPLHDLTHALWDLGRGGQPRLLQPTVGVGKGGELTSKRWVRQNALLAVAVLETAGFKADAACKLVATALGKAGHTGRKRQDGTLQPLSHKTVSGWRTKSRQRDFKHSDPLVAQFLERNLARMRLRDNWPFSPEAATRWLEAVTTSDLTRSKI
ncbi:hypothetical protein [uncultured Sphingomonas sp.]|uniref:hypothetical protein n=1 Tax=uncultured Sphingomonas sp. TaxID=158754 RepID=UPI0025D9046C|nr:hypothetical protein [uncultured Sphingomonas sp.]